MSKTPFDQTTFKMWSKSSNWNIILNGSFPYPCFTAPPLSKHFWQIWEQLWPSGLWGVAPGCTVRKHAAQIAIHPHSTNPFWPAHGMNHKGSFPCAQVPQSHQVFWKPSWPSAFWGFTLRSSVGTRPCQPWYTPFFSLNKHLHIPIKKPRPKREGAAAREGHAENPERVEYTPLLLPPIAHGNRS